MFPDSQPDPVTTRLLCFFQSKFKQDLPKTAALKSLQEIDTLDFKGIFQLLLRLGRTLVKLKITSYLMINS